MAITTGVWRTESSEAKQTIAAIVAFGFGVLLAIGFRFYGEAGAIESRAGFMLGVVLVVVGCGMLVVGGKQVITVDAKAKKIVIEKINRVQQSVQEIRFSEITMVSVGETGDEEGGSIRYHVAVKLRTGKEVALFMGFYEGVHSKQAMEARCQRLNESLRTNG